MEYVEETLKTTCQFLHGYINRNNTSFTRNRA